MAGIAGLMLDIDGRFRAELCAPAPIAAFRCAGTDHAASLTISCGSATAKIPIAAGA